MAFISLNTQYKAPTFEEQIRPYLAYAEAYNQMEEGLDTLNQEANKYSAFIDPNSEAYKTVQSYKDELKNLSNTLYEQGMNRNNNFSAVRALRRQFNDSILPINTAAVKLEEYNTEKRKLEAQGLRVYNMPSIDQYIKDPTSTYKVWDPKTTLAVGTLMGANDLANAETKHRLDKIDATNNLFTSWQEVENAKIQAVLDGSSDILHKQAIADGIDPNSEIYNQYIQTLARGYVQGSTPKKESKVLANDLGKANLEVNTYARKAAIELSNQKKLLKEKAAKSSDGRYFITKTYENPYKKSHEPKVNGMSFKANGKFSKELTSHLLDFGKTKNHKELYKYIKQSDGSHGAGYWDWKEMNEDNAQITKLWIAADVGKIRMLTSDGHIWDVSSRCFKNGDQIHQGLASIKELYSHTKTAENKSAQLRIDNLANEIFIAINDEFNDIAKVPTETLSKDTDIY